MAGLLVLEATVLLDRDLGLSTSVSVAHGSTVLAVKEELCRSDPTGQTRIEDIALVDGSSGQHLADWRLLTEDLAQRLELCPPGSADSEVQAPTLPAEEPGLPDQPLPVQEQLQPAAEVAQPAPAEPAAAPVVTPKRKAGAAAAPDIGQVLAHASAALSKDSDDGAANAVFGAIGGALKFKSLRPQLLLARGLLFWRWSRLDRALKDLSEARRLGASGALPALLALQICLGRWPEARDGVREMAQQEEGGQAAPAEDANCEASYEVVHDFITLRNEPSTKGKIVGTLKRGASVLGIPWRVNEEPWIKLTPQKLPAPAPGAPAKEVSASDGVYALTDASSIPSLKLGTLLERVGGPQKLDVKGLEGQVEQWISMAEKFQLVFFPQAAPLVRGDQDVLPGVRQSDVQVPAPGGGQLGLRLLLQLGPDGRPDSQRPLVLVFHGEDQNVTHWLEDAQIGPLREARASTVVADFRGYGFSSGTPSLAWLGVDADAVCDALPQIFNERGLPWPWPGRLGLLGTQIGSRAACYLAGTRGDFFDLGLVLDSAWCGSRAPGAAPPPDGKRHTALASMGCNAVGGNRFGTAEMAVTLAELGRSCGQLVARAGFPSAAHMCFVRDNEDLIRGYDGRLLILHGSEDHQIPSGHAERLCDAAEAATRKLVIVRGKMQDSLRGCREYNDALKKFLAAP